MEYPTFNGSVKNSHSRQIGESAVSNWLLLGFCWKSVYWDGKVATFWLVRTSFVYPIYSQKGINRILINNEYNVLHYLDDFLAVEDTLAVAADF